MVFWLRMCYYILVRNDTSLHNILFYLRATTKWFARANKNQERRGKEDGKERNRKSIS